MDWTRSRNFRYVNIGSLRVCIPIVYYLGSVKLVALKRGEKQRIAHQLSDTVAAHAVNYQDYAPDSLWTECREFVALSKDDCRPNNWVTTRSPVDVSSWSLSPVNHDSILIIWMQGRDNHDGESYSDTHANRRSRRSKSCNPRKIRGCRWSASGLANAIPLSSRWREDTLHCEDIGEKYLQYNRLQNSPHDRMSSLHSMLNMTATVLDVVCLAPVQWYKRGKLLHKKKITWNTFSPHQIASSSICTHCTTLTCCGNVYQDILRGQYCFIQIDLQSIWSKPENWGW